MLFISVRRRHEETVLDMYVFVVGKVLGYGNGRGHFPQAMSMVVASGIIVTTPLTRSFVLSGAG